MQNKNINKDNKIKKHKPIKHLHIKMGYYIFVYKN
ncbi:hypothetical protein QJ854_gp697 [Moumouvirus goulette]|uniref:Uncharacterized protein n=1 Tax=Moumouvirus goulette TaxID=1247379 RepID=M1NM38_9VIRU|nr:hypothetical protein QJ854_gp697 [Moumouvirus goulette]AGF85085.1 hypothetical protein glt_00276 [Moumouvirus goulette]